MAANSYKITQSQINAVLDLLPAMRPYYGQIGTRDDAQTRTIAAFDGIAATLSTLPLIEDEMATGTSLEQDDLCTIIGVESDGTEVILGQGPVSWKAKAKDIFRSYGFEPYSEHDLAPCYALSAVDDLVKWMIKVGWKTPPLVTIPAATSSTVN